MGQRDYAQIPREGVQVTKLKLRTVGAPSPSAGLQCPQPSGGKRGSPTCLQPVTLRVTETGVSWGWWDTLDSMPMLQRESKLFWWSYSIQDRYYKETLLITVEAKQPPFNSDPDLTSTQRQLVKLKNRNKPKSTICVWEILSALAGIFIAHWWLRISSCSGTSCELLMEQKCGVSKEWQSMADCTDVMLWEKQPEMCNSFCFRIKGT